MPPNWLFEEKPRSVSAIGEPQLVIQIRGGYDYAQGLFGGDGDGATGAGRLPVPGGAGVGRAG